MFIMRKIKNLVFFLIRIFISEFPAKRKKHYDIIIVRVDLIGDFIMRYDSLIELKKQIVGKKVMLICSESVKPFITDDVFFADIISYKIKEVSNNLKYFFRFSKLLKKYSADIIYYQAWERYIEGDIIISCLKGNEIIGMNGIDVRGLSQRYYDRKYTKLINFPNDKHELLQIEHFVRSTFNPNYVYGKNSFVLKKKDYPNIIGPYVVISISSSMEEKMWPIDRFAKLIDYIPDFLLVVITGVGNKDYIRAQQILQLVKNKRKVINYVGKTSVMDLAHLISQSKFVIGNDSSAVHIAAATRVPSICLLHGAHYGRFFPYPDSIMEKKYLPRIVHKPMKCYNCNYKCIFSNTKPFKCLDGISVDMALCVLNELLLELHFL